MRKRAEKLERRARGTRPIAEPANPLVGGRQLAEKDFFAMPMGQANKELQHLPRLKRVELKGA